MAAINEQISVD